MKTPPKPSKTQQRDKRTTRHHPEFEDHHAFEGMVLQEAQRLKHLVIHESFARSQGFRVIAGLDEAGRGPLAGPVVAAACIISEGLFFEGINDSKLLSFQKREDLYLALTEHKGVIFGVGEASVEEIDTFNILQATLLAMRRALEVLPIQPDYLLADALNISYNGLPCEKIIKGDQKSQSIAGASILAKVTRDRWMEKLHLLYPHYGFAQHKGYGTPDHLKALATHGPCPIHRTSFEPIKSLL